MSRPKLLCIYLTLCFTNFCNNAFSQAAGSLSIEYPSRHFTTKDGLPQNECSELFKDSRGYLWVSTKGGIIRYDGSNLLAFDHKYGFNAQYHRLAELKDGSIVVGCTGHIMLIKGLQMRKIEMPFEKEGYSIERIYPANNVESFIAVIVKLSVSGTQERLFAGYNRSTGKWEKLYRFYIKDNETLYLINDTVSLVAGGRTPGLIWRYPQTVYLRLYKSGKIYHTSVLPFPAVLVRCYNSNLPFFYIPRTNTLLAPVFAKDTISFTGIRLDRRISQEFFPYQLYFLHADSFFIVAGKDSWQSVRGKLSHLASAKQSIAFFHYTDNQLWTTGDDGLKAVYLNGFRGYVFNDMPGHFWSISKIPGTGNYLAGSYDNGFYITDKTAWKRLAVNPDKKTSEDKLYAYYGSRWFPEAGVVVQPTHAGVLCFTKEGMPDHININSAIMHTAYDPVNHCMYLAGYNGGVLYRLNKDLTIDTLAYGSESGMNSMLCIVMNKYNQPVCGNSLQARVFTDGSFKKMPDIHHGFRSADRDGKGNLWMGSFDTLFFYDYHKEIPVTNPFIKTKITAVKNYFDRWLIIGTLNGIVLLDLEKWYAGKTISSFAFDAGNGYVFGECTQNGFLIDDDSTVWITYDRGLVHFDPRQLINKASGMLPQVQIDKAGSLVSGKWQDVSFENDLRLTRADRTIRLYFSTASLSNRSFISVRYRLIPFDTAWTVATDGFAEYQRLPPGRFSFEIQSGYDGKSWEAAALPLRIYIQPFYYETWWFRMLLLLVFVSAIAGITYYITRKRKLAQLRGAQLQQRMNELQLQAIRSKALPHFTGNAFASVDYYIEHNDRENASKYVAILSRLYNMTLLDAEKPARKLEDELRYVTMYLQIEKLRFGDKIDYSVVIAENTPQAIWVPNMILHTYAENAVRHGLMHKNGKGTIRITARPENDGVLLAVEDDGIGMEASEEFNGTTTKQGLSILEQQIELYNRNNHVKIIRARQDLKDNSGKACGTRFTVWIPEHFRF
jgi:two-component sensor histidine kinase